MPNDTPPFDGFYENSIPIFHRSVLVTEADLMPSGCVNARVLMSLANKMKKLEYWRKSRGDTSVEAPCLRLIQTSSEGRVTALVESGSMTLKLALRRNASSTGEDEWVVLGDALKVSD